MIAVSHEEPLHYCISHPEEMKRIIANATVMSMRSGTVAGKTLFRQAFYTSTLFLPDKYEPFYL